MSLRADAIACGICPDCLRRVEGKASIACPSCHKRRQEQLAALATHGCGGLSCTDEDEAKMTPISGGQGNNETRRMYSGARNGMVMCKGEIYGG